MDYSLLIGVHFREAVSYRDSPTPPRNSGARTPRGYSSHISISYLFLQHEQYNYIFT